MQNELTPVPRTRFRPAYRHFQMTFVLWNAAVVVHSAETRLMAIKAFDVDVRKADRRAVNRLPRTLCTETATAVYSERRVIQAVRDTNEQLAHSFPNQYMTLAYIGGSNRSPRSVQTENAAPRPAIER